MSIKFKERLSPGFWGVIREWIYAMLQKDQSHPSAKDLETNLVSIFNAMYPAIKNRPNQQWTSKGLMSGTDGPMHDGIIRWDNVSVPGRSDMLR